jgi:hypothetical protein
LLHVSRHGCADLLSLPDRIHLVLYGMQTRIFNPYLATINWILVSRGRLPRAVPAWAASTSRLGHLIPIWRPLIGSSFPGRRYEQNQVEAVRQSREIRVLQAALAEASGQGEQHAMAHHLAAKHEARDRCLLALQRLQEVEGAVHKRQGFNYKQARRNRRRRNDSFVTGVVCVSLRLSVHRCLHPSMCPSAHTCLRPSVCPSICLSDCLSVCLSVARLPVHPFARQSIWSICPSAS